MEIVGRKKDFCLCLTVVDRNCKSSGCFARTAVIVIVIAVLLVV